MNTKTYNNIIERLNAFANGHYFLRSFSHGQIDSLDIAKETNYPLMFAKPTGMQIGQGEQRYSFDIIFADMPSDKTSATDRQKEVISDMLRVAEDLVNEIHQGQTLFGSDISLERPVNVEPFIKEFANTLSGVVLSITIIAPYNWSACAIPADWAIIQSGEQSVNARAGLLLRVNGTNNTVQNVLDLVAGDNMEITDNGDGTVSITATGGTGGGLSLGETSSTAYRGDRGKTAYDHSQTTGNPHGTTAAQVGADPSGSAAAAQTAAEGYADTVSESAKQAAIDHADEGLSTKAPLVHTHAIADVTGLQTELNGKASTSHTHAISDVTGLQTALDGKASSSHTHIISDVTGLQTALDGKAASSHTHTASQVTDFNTAALAAAPAETTTTIGALVNGATSKTTPVDADQIGLMDSAASNVLKKLSWANIKATLKTYFDTLYQAAGTYLTAANNLSDVSNKFTAKSNLGIRDVGLANNFTTSSTTLADVTGLGVSVEANKKYRGEFNFVLSGSTGGARFAFTFPSGATLYVGMTGASTTTSAQTMVYAQPTSGTELAFSFSSSGLTNGYVEGEFYITTSSTSGTLQVQMKATTSGQSNTMNAGLSHIEIREVE